MTNNKSQKIILVSYHFSSEYETGGIRVRKFAKYLPQHGFDPIIVTRKRKHLRQFNGRIVFLRTIPIKWPFHLEAFTWIPSLFLTCVRLIRSEKIRILFFSCGPFSAALIGILLRKVFKVKLVLDFRDYWTISPYLPKIPRFNQFLNIFQKPLERMLLKSTDRLITIQKTMEESYEKTFPFLTGRVGTIFNGFEKEDVSGPDHKLFEKFTILHLGNIHMDLNPFYPLIFLDSLQKMRDEKTIDESFFQVLLIGEKFEFVSRKIQALGLSGIVRNIERLPHKEALVFLKRSHLLLLITETEGIMTSKIFEYIATGKPILALIKEGEIKDLIVKYSKHSYPLIRPNIEQLVKAIKDCMENYSYRSNVPGESFLAIYNRENQTKQLVMVLNELLEK